MRKKRDTVDTMNRNPLRQLQRLMGAHLYHCDSCRLQFYDLRPLRAEAQQIKGY
jgi:hypothetical protein